MGNRTVSSPLPGPLLQFRSLGSCPDFPSRWTTSDRDEIIPSSPWCLRSWWCLSQQQKADLLPLQPMAQASPLLSHTPFLSISPLPHSLSPSAVGWQKTRLGEFWHLWSGCRLLLEKPTAEQTVTTALRTCKTPSFFPEDFLSQPSGLTQALSGLFDFIFSFLLCFYSVDRENPSQEQYAITEMRCLLAHFWTPKPPSTPRLLLFHQPQCSTSNCSHSFSATVQQPVPRSVTKCLFPSLPRWFFNARPAHLWPFSSQCVCRGPGTCQEWRAGPSSLYIPFAPIKSPFQVLSAGLLVSTLSPGPAAGLTDLPSFPCCHRASLESFPGPLTPCGLEPLLSDTAEPVTE